MERTKSDGICLDAGERKIKITLIMNGNTINVILIKKCYQKGTPMKDATSIAFDLKNLFTLGNSVRFLICFRNEMNKLQGVKNIH